MDLKEKLMQESLLEKQSALKSLKRFCEQMSDHPSLEQTSFLEKIKTLFDSSGLWTTRSEVETFIHLLLLANDEIEAVKGEAPYAYAVFDELAGKLMKALGQLILLLKE